MKQIFIVLQNNNHEQLHLFVKDHEMDNFEIAIPNDFMATSLKLRFKELGESRNWVES